MLLLIDVNNKIVSVDDDNSGVVGGNIVVNGKTYNDIVAIQYDGDLPRDIDTPERYIYRDGEVILNPDSEGDDIYTRLNDIEQILIDLLDTM